MLKQLFTRKNIQDLSPLDQKPSARLEQSLGLLGLTSLGIGAIIGAGIFVITGQAAAQHAGPAVIISFLLAGTVSGFSALCYAEFASLVPFAGSAYTYSYVVFGEIIAWIMGGIQSSNMHSAPQQSLPDGWGT